LLAVRYQLVFVGLKTFHESKLYGSAVVFAILGHQHLQVNE
jgi:hypothetical protein